MEDLFPDLHEGPWPDYVSVEVELFRAKRDLNGDGKLDLSEVGSVL